MSVVRWQVPVKVLNLSCQDKTLLNTARRLSLTDPNICANGPAIWGGCVTRRSIRPPSRFFSQKIVPVQGGYGACFCRHGTSFIEHWRGRGTSLLSGRKVVPVQEESKWALVQ